MTAPAHGGQLRAIAEQFGLREENLLDLSASIHPFAPSPQVLATLARRIATGAGITTYPESTYADLRAAIATYTQAAPQAISVANGGMPLLGAALRAFSVTRALVLIPAFSEYRRTLHAAGTQFLPFLLHAQNGFLPPDTESIVASARTQKAQAVLLANPHSPSGTLLTQSFLTTLAEQLATTQTLLIVDEAFIDFAPHASVTLLAQSSKNLVVLRSLTKFFAIPGARVAYAISHADNRQHIDAYLPQWPIDTFAAELAALQLAEDPEPRRTIIETERAWLSQRLQALGMKVFPSHANFLLFHCDHPKNLWETMIASHGIVMRDCSTFEGLGSGYYRVAVRTRPESERLLQALKEAL